MRRLPRHEGALPAANAALVAASDTSDISAYASSLLSRDTALAEQAFGVVRTAYEQEQVAEASLQQALAWSGAMGGAVTGTSALGAVSSGSSGR